MPEAERTILCKAIGGPMEGSTWSAPYPPPAKKRFFKDVRRGDEHQKAQRELVDVVVDVYVFERVSDRTYHALFKYESRFKGSRRRAA